MLTSLRVGAQRIGAGPAQSKALCVAFLNAYASALTLGKAYWVDPRTAW